MLSPLRLIPDASNGHTKFPSLEVSARNLVRDAQGIGVDITSCLPLFKELNPVGVVAVACERVLPHAQVQIARATRTVRTDEEDKKPPVEQTEGSIPKA